MYRVITRRNMGWHGNTLDMAWDETKFDLMEGVSNLKTLPSDVPVPMVLVLKHLTNDIFKILLFFIFLFTLFLQGTSIVSKHNQNVQGHNYQKNVI